METAVQYIGRIHEEFSRHPDIIPIGFCELFSRRVAKRLVQEGKTPQFLWVGDRNEEGSIGYIFSSLMYPRSGMAGHSVCCTEGMAYDPLIGRPVPIESYCNEAFGRDLPMKEETVDLEREKPIDSIFLELAGITFSID